MSKPGDPVTTAQAQRLPDKWNRGGVLGYAEPELLLYRSNLLGLRSAHHELRRRRTRRRRSSMKDPLTGEQVRRAVGEGLRRRSRPHEDGRLRDASTSRSCIAPKALSRPRPRGRDGALLPALHLQPEPARDAIDTPPHCFIPHRTSTTCTPTRSSRLPRRRTASDSRASVSATRWADPLAAAGLRPGPEGRRRCRRQSRPTGLILGSHGLVTWGTPQGLLQATLRVIQQAADWLDAKRGPSPSARWYPPRCRREPGAPSSRRDRPGAARLALEPADAEGPALQRRRQGARFRRASPVRGAGRQGHDLPRSFPAHADPAALCSVRARARDSRPSSRPPAGRWSSATASDYAAYYERCKQADFPAMRDPTRCSCWFPASDSCRSRRTSSPHASPPSTGQHHQRDAVGRGRRRVRAHARAGGVQHRVLGARGSQAQASAKAKSLAGRIALVTGGAGGIGSAIARRFLAEDAHVVITDIDQDALDAAVADLSRAHGPTRCEASAAT